MLLKTLVAQLNHLLLPAVLLQVAGLVIAIAGAILLGRRIKHTHAGKLLINRTGVRYRVIEALLLASPHILALGSAAALSVTLHLFGASTELVDVVIPLLGLLLLVRLAVYLLRLSVSRRVPLKGWGNTLSLLIWTVLALHVLGWFEVVVGTLDSIALTTGTTRISIWSVIKLLFTVSIFVIAALWLARWIERRLMAFGVVAINMRIGLAKFAQVSLIGLSILLGLNAAGLDLTTLNLLTGAIGIGLGFGLQAIASNFVSGFVLLMDRSIKPGDVISFSASGTTTEGFGWVQELRGRYVVVRDRDGVETLVPNQQLITNPVINWSYTDPRVRLKLPVRVSYDCNPELALAVLLEAAKNHERVLQDPEPVSRFMSFGNYGFELELRFWIADPQEGVNNVRSDINRAIWRLFKQQGIQIPVPQYEVALKRGGDFLSPARPLE